MVRTWQKTLLTLFLLGVLLSSGGRASEDDEEVTVTEEVVVSICAESKRSVKNTAI